MNFLSPFLSSIIAADIPNLSIDLMFISKCSGFPPVSASIIKGFVVTSKISLMLLSLLLKSSTSISGRPLKVESVNELDQKPSNSEMIPLLSL